MIQGYGKRVIQGLSMKTRASLKSSWDISVWSNTDARVRTCLACLCVRVLAWRPVVTVQRRIGSTESSSLTCVGVCVQIVSTFTDACAA